MIKDLIYFSKLRDLKTMDAHLRRQHSPGWYKLVRFLVYGCLLTVYELIFYTLIKAGTRIPLLGFLFQFNWHVDPALGLDKIMETPIHVLYGQASLYMIFVYAAVSFFWVEFVFRKFNGKPVFLRGFLYAIGIAAGELATGWLLYLITGYKIWYYTGPYQILTFTSLAILWLWALLPISLEPFMFSMLAIEKKDKLLKEALEKWEESKEKDLKEVKSYKSA